MSLVGAEGGGWEWGRVHAPFRLGIGVGPRVTPGFPFPVCKPDPAVSLLLIRSHSCEGRNLGDFLLSVSGPWVFKASDGMLSALSSPVWTCPADNSRSALPGSPSQLARSPRGCHSSSVIRVHIPLSVILNSKRSENQTFKNKLDIN